jgi:hypothetical protein
MLVRDNFLSDPEMIAAIKADDTFFPPVMETFEDRGSLGDLQGQQYHSEEASCYAPYMFWDGWWNSPANTLKKQVIQQIWQCPESRDFDLGDIVGFEYWTRTFVPPQYLPHHVDEDTFQYALDKTFNAPISGCIWYGFSEAPDGGMLEIHKPTIEGSPWQVLDNGQIEAYLSGPEDRERIAYKPNRLIVFDAGRRMHETTPLINGKRQIMVVNVWHKDSPPMALQTGEFFYE